MIIRALSAFIGRYDTIPWFHGAEFVMLDAPLFQTILPGRLLLERNSILAFSMLVALTGSRVLHSPLDFTITRFSYS